ncbi:N-acetylmuramoyl-L-alanine amidase [Streptomyces sp. NPDC002845]
MRARRWWGAGAVVAAGVCGALVVQGVSGGAADGADDDGRPGPVSGPVESEARTVSLKMSGDGASAELGRRDTEPFSMLGVTWANPGDEVAGTVEVRTRAAGSGTWSSWLELDGDGPGESGADRAGTEPAWVGLSDGVEVRVDGKSSARLPEGLRLDMIDPGGGTVTPLDPAAFVVEGTESPEPTESTATDGTTEPTGEPTASETAPEAETETEPGSDTDADTPSPSTSAPETSAPDKSATESASPSAPAAASASAPAGSAAQVPAPRPPITSRAGWGADESISPEEPGYLPGGKIKAVVVHHTAESNSYTCAEAPAVVRGIYAYHVKQLGWRDIGYNFLVDKCGTVYEGRKGGVDKPVMGAHTYGFNTETTGISVLGTYTDAAPSKAALTSVARVAAWKLGQYGVDPKATVTLTAGVAGTNYFRESWAQGAKLSFPAILGHRDGYNTQCPGDAFHAKLDTVRTLASPTVTGLKLNSVTGAALSGSTYYTKATITASWSATTPAELIDRYELRVDGQTVATTEGTVTSAGATLAAGTHTVRIRAVHQSGRTTTTPAATVVSETTAPTFPTRPKLSLRTGTVNSGAVPVTLRWKATDNAALKEVRLTSPVRGTYGPAVTVTKRVAKSGTATKWSLKAYDFAGNTRTASVTGTPVILQEGRATKTGTWTAKSSKRYLGGRSYTSKSKGASLKWTFTGRSAAWVVSRASSSGQAHIYVDGRKVKTVDLKSSTVKYRNAIWTKTWSSSAKHTVKIVVVGTSGRPTVTTDGLVYLK